MYAAVPVLVALLFWGVVSARGGGGSALASLSAPNVPTFAYTVVPGDTLQTVAAAFGTTPATLQAVNRLASAAVPHPGRQLRIPRPARGFTLDGTFPSAIRALVETAARQFHVDVALALAVAWQESRARQQAVSDTNAIGIMQMEPDTAKQVASQLGYPIDLHDAGENVTAGVYWLGYLLRFYGGDVQKAVAAYYEGQTNFSRYGYLPDGRQYMQSVLRFRVALSGG